MKSIMPTAILIIGMAIIAMLSTSLITFQMQISAAKNFHTGCVDRIQSSYYNPTVIGECQTEALANGYELTVEEKTVYEDRTDYLVKLDYDAQMVFLGVEKEGSFESFAK